MRRDTGFSVNILILSAALAGAASADDPDAGSFPASPAALERHIEELNAQLGVTFWLADTLGNRDTEMLASYADREMTRVFASGIAKLRTAGPAAWSDEDRRKLMLLQHRPEWPLQEDPESRAELQRLVTDLRRSTATTALCLENGPCLDRRGVEDLMRHTADPLERRVLWQNWLEQLSPGRDRYPSVVSALNEAAVEWGYIDFGDWRLSRYETEIALLQEEIEALWGAIKPLYTALHCHVRARLANHYGIEEPGRGGPIPPYLLDSLDPRDWGELYRLMAVDLPEPPSLDQSVPARFASVEELAHIAAAFFGTLGYPPLPESFWQRSNFDAGMDGDDCRQSGWNVDWRRDVRVSTCSEVGEKNFRWLHWIIAHLQYDLAFSDLDWSYRDPPHPGFHRAHAGVAILSLTPVYLRGLGLTGDLPDDRQELARLLRQALQILPQIAGNLATEKWRWSVFGGRVSVDDYNRQWWHLWRRYAGISDSAAEDTGFAAALLPETVTNEALLPDVFGTLIGYQLLAAGCADASVALHQCSVAGDKAFGSRLWSMLSVGASRPWRDALELATGSRKISAAALVEYYAPLRHWLDEQNQARSCGW